jgi:very-short-patch-repair endonuclease
MISDNYLPALERFAIEETRMIKINPHVNKFYKPDGYYEKMYNFVSANPAEFIPFKESGVHFIEMEFAESVKVFKDKLISLAKEFEIPEEVLFIPTISIEVGKRESIIHVKVAELIRKIIDTDTDEEFQTLRLYKIVERKSAISKWIKTKNGKNFLFEFQISEGIREDVWVKNRLYLFDKSFVYEQMRCMSTKMWIHNVVIDAFERWEKDNKLWRNIDHLKRKIQNRELYDESRYEIKFLRLLESNGYSKRFIHDENISWQVKYRPDFWFVKEGLIVEYDEKAHRFQIEEDRRREKIIQKYIPNINFIRVREGFEVEGLKEINEYLIRFESKYEL